jgi:hypothetical protein
MSPDPNGTLRGELISEVNDLIRGRQSEIAHNYPLVRVAYKTCYGLPELDPLRHEITLCLVFGLYQAAVTLTNHLLESMLKYALAYHYALKHPPVSSPPHGAAAKHLVDWLAEGNALYANKKLGHNINQACTNGIITKIQKERLHEFRNAFRNAYSHADKKKTFGEASTPVTAVRFDPNGLVVDAPEQVGLAELLIGHGFFQSIHAQQNALRYFLEIDAITHHVMKKVFPNLQVQESPDP